MTARDLIVLQGEIDKNAAIIGSLQHETALTLATVSGQERALKKHLLSLQEELRTVRDLTIAMQARVQGGPTVKQSEVDAAIQRRNKKKEDLKTIQREVRLLEGILHEFIDVEPLRIRELFDVSDPNDEIALAMVLDARK
ncbi:Hypothetical protein, putative [Bodo saltans]|uniref:Uncharacterized protein n=1 Tax=Bodo saltans TaxID=75058 RepID=A0A0S4JT87_BODSA|nr:Hypothetical protein, putative [Bodo saltans]|eukprot:CUG93447.1 Hypothetical protein, putative [Bodo saltans]